MISKKCKYAIRAILFLAVESDEKNKKGIKEIAENLKLPGPYLGKILQQLVPKNIITSAKGPNGGFYTTEKNLRIPLIKVIETIDGLAYFEGCGLGLSECSDDHPCPIHTDFKKSRNRMKKVFENKTIETLASEIKHKEFFLVL